ncbi:MAG TPA: TetR/AcrR family transcriptional regulator [Polyangiales bacterium]|nr:TetR/AcrR family transcriptional regulator [Polyangiales bacterium]
MEFLKQMGVTGDPQDPTVRTRTRLLQAATKLFQSRGYQHTSVDEIAREAGLAKGTVYVHFKNKQELLLHAIAEEKKHLVQAILPALTADVSPAERLVRYLEQGFLALQQAPLISKLMLGDRQILMQLSGIGEDLREQLHELQIKSVTALVRGIGAFDELSTREKNQRVRVLLGVLVSATQLVDESVRGGLSLEIHARQLAKIIVAGVGAK